MCCFLFLLFVYICIAVVVQVIKRGKAKEPINSFNPATFLCPSQVKINFQTSYIVVYFMFNDLRLESIVRFVHHHCVNCFFHNACRISLVESFSFILLPGELVTFIFCVFLLDLSLLYLSSSNRFL